VFQWFDPAFGIGTLFELRSVADVRLGDMSVGSCVLRAPHDHAADGSPLRFLCRSHASMATGLTREKMASPAITKMTCWARISGAAD